MTGRAPVRALPVAAGAAAVLAIDAAAAAIAGSSAFAEDPSLLAAAIALDLTVTATLAMYLLGVRRGRLPRAALAPVFVAGLVASRWIVPDGHRDVASALATAWVVAEIALAAWLLARLRAVVATYRRRRGAGAPLPDSLESALAAALGDGAVSRLLAAELSLLLFATAGLARRPPADRCPERDERQWFAVLLGLGVAMTAEAVAVYLLVSTWSATAAVIAAAVHAYATLWLIGDYRALRLSRGIAVDRDHLHIDLGLHARAVIPLAQIERVERIAAGGDSADGADPAGGIRATVWGRPNLWLYLHAPVTVRLSLGRLRTASIIGIAAADPDGLEL